MDAQAIATNGLKSASRMFRQDLDALPAEAFAKSFGPAVRTVADIVYEVKLVNGHIGMVMKGEEPFVWPEGWVTAPEDFKTKEAVLAGFDESITNLLSYVEGLPAEAFESPLTTDEGETTRFERCRFMAMHLWYHSGQLNFIQTLLGDDAWHWK